MYGGAEAIPKPEPEVLVLAPVEQPGAERYLLLLLPGIGGPAPLALRALDERNVLTRVDDVDSGLDDCLVAVGPVSGDLGHGDRPVPLEPDGFCFACGHLPGENDLERALTESDFGHGSETRQGYADHLVRGEKAVGAVDRPVQLLLESNHSGTDRGVRGARLDEARAGRDAKSGNGGRLKCSHFLGEGIQSSTEL